MAATFARRIVPVVMLTFMTLALGGCAHLDEMLFPKKKTHRATSVMAYLYPEADYRALTATANISVPATVGIAFVPGGGSLGMSRDTMSPVSEKEKSRLLELVRQRFEQYEFIGRIEPIPTAYLRENGGFDNLRQIGSMFNVDLMVLLSYDQIQFDDPKASSLAYWTVVGLYLFKGETNTTQTLLDAVVIDIKSQNMLFRAPGISDVEGTSTALKQSEAQRQQAVSGFRLAAADLMENLDRQLLTFRDRVKANQEPEVQVTYRQGHSSGGMGGAMGGAGAALALAAVALAWWRRDP
ncbi:MAG: rhombotarget lipoprotein [Nitrospirota bacterium]|nr:rhombotarget lipoprotein [Nitrospirota bacterium]